MLTERGNRGEELPSAAEADPSGGEGDRAEREKEEGGEAPPSAAARATPSVNKETDEDAIAGERKAAGYTPPASVLSFPETLHDVVSNEEHDDIIAWLPHGRGFIIKDRTRFESEILPRYFDNAKFASFSRRIIRWRFERITGGAYYHANFVRDKPELLQRMQLAMTNPSGLQVVEKGRLKDPIADRKMRNKECAKRLRVWKKIMHENLHQQVWGLMDENSALKMLVQKHTQNAAKITDDCCSKSSHVRLFLDGLKRYDALRIWHDRQLRRRNKSNKNKS